jgi:MarR family transcriptional regulator, temperature-dependent positive regulator of motility
VRPMIAHVKRVRTSVLFELYVAGQLVNELVSREVERLGLRGPAQILLWHVALHGPLTPTELERATGLRPSTLRERMQPLFDGGLVRRVPSEVDRRSHTLVVTERGRELLDAARPTIDGAERALEAQLEGGLEQYRPMLEDLVRAGQAALAD